MSDIRFYIPEGETVPTDLRLKVGETDVTYERIRSGYRFYIHMDDEEEALKIAEQITQRIRNEQSEPQHGVTWVTVAMCVVKQEERYRIGTIVDWKYRVRDVY